MPEWQQALGKIYSWEIIAYSDGERVSAWYNSSGKAGQKLTFLPAWKQLHLSPWRLAVTATPEIQE